jgi:molybdopterin-synthase adenylyltransferase
MSDPARVCLLGSLEQRLREHLTGHPRGHERAAAVLFRRHHQAVPGLAESDRYVGVEVVPFEEAWNTSSSPTHVDFDVAPLRDLFRRCEDEGLVFGFAHNHPGGLLEFSEQDDRNERTLLEAISNRNGPNVTFVALLLSEGTWLARTRSATRPGTASLTRHVAVLAGHRMLLHGTAVDDPGEGDEDVLARQAAAFGRPFVGTMKSLRIGVVGASGTGSPTGTLLVRSGASELILFDPDKLAKSNLNRIRGARKADVGRNKAAWLREYVLGLDLGASVASFETNVDEDADAIDALATCDLMFGCTDDQIGREVLNAACFVYGIPLIDMGLGGWVDKDGSGAIRLRGHYGRISTVCPEAGDCLECQGIVTREGVRRQFALRNDPDLTEDQLRERYLVGGGEQAPGVGPFTSAVGDYAVATLYDMLTGFRRLPETLRADILLIDFVLMEMRSPQSTADPTCPLCGTRQMLLRTAKYRLNRPFLGETRVAL